MRHQRPTTKQLFRRSQLWLVFLSLFASLLAVVGSTYAWVTLEDARLNRLAIQRLEVVLEGQQGSDVLTPLFHGEKRLKVRNNATANAIVRVSLAEVLLTFEVDMTDLTGNGNLLDKGEATAEVINSSQTETWQPGRTFKTPQGYYLVGKERATMERYQWAVTNEVRPTIIARSVGLGFTTDLTNQFPPQTPITRQYWLYHDGYFYYSEVLRPGESTPSLLDTVSVAPNAPNEVKGSLYQLQGTVQGYSATLASVTEESGWGLAKQTPVYRLFETRLK